MSGLLLCDPCYMGATGLLPECQDCCNLSLTHHGLCAPFARAAAPTRCNWCGQEDRLHEVERDSEIMARLPTAGERGEGQWFLNWPSEQLGPFPSRRAAWDAWHSYAEDQFYGRPPQ